MSQGDEVLLSEPVGECDPVPACGSRTSSNVLRYIGIDDLFGLGVFFLAWVITIQVGVGVNPLVERTWNIFSSALIMTLWVAATVGFIVFICRSLPVLSAVTQFLVH